ncbi:MAG: tyrosine-type recombinase/integrase [Nitrososphaeraceae archaeon]
MIKVRQEQQQNKAWGPGIRRKAPIIYRVTTGSLSNYTKETYQCHINDFLAFYKLTDIEPLKEYSPKLIKQMVLDYVLELRDERKISRSSIKNHCAALSLFFYMIRDDDTRLNWTKVRMEFPPDERINRDRAYTSEEIQKMLNNGCSGRLREKAILLLLTSTGMRIGGIHPLQMKDLTAKITTQGKVYRIEVYSSSSARYYCYCNVETASTIDDYLKERQSNGEVLQSDSPLFRDLRMLNVKNVKPLSSFNVKYIVGKIVEKSGITSTFQFTGEAKRSKGLRKYYKTTAELAGMKPVNVELTHGHSIGISDHYYRPNESEVLEDYMTHAADALTINQENRLRQKVQNLESQQAREIEQLKERVQSIDECASKMARYARALDEGRVIKLISPDKKTRVRIFETDTRVVEEESEAAAAAD